MVPYSGTIGAVVDQFEPGHVVVRLRDRRRVRNHLGSVHAIALANVGELATGLAILGAMDESVRGILTGIEVAYTKKARGPLRVEAVADIPDVGDASVDTRVSADIVDTSGEVVSVVHAQWRLGPARR